MRLVISLSSCLVACAPDNELAEPGDCEVAGIDDTTSPSATPIALGPVASFDDLFFSHALDRVLAIPEHTGTLWLVDAETADVTMFAGLPSRIATGDATATHVYLGDRGNRRVVVLDAASGDIVQLVDLPANPDYVRITPAGDELWVTEPGKDGIEVLAIGQDGMLMASSSFIDVPGGPEGLTFDVSSDRAYVHRFSGPVVAIDVAGHEVVDTWDTGCESAHGFPQVDGERGLLFAGCSSEGGAAVLDATNGHALAGVEAGGDASILAYDASLGHLYLRGDPGGDLAMLAVCDSGGLAELTAVSLSQAGHGMTSDGRGNVWVADATTGGLLHVRDPYPAP